MTYTPYSTNTFITTVANEQNFNVTWTSPYYLEPTDVFAEVNGDPWTVSSVSGTTVTLQTGIPANARVLIYRETDISDNIVNFSAGSTFRAQDVNADFDQLLFKAQENTDFTNRLDDEIDLLTELVTNSLQFISVQNVEELNTVAATDPDNLKGYEVRDSTNIDTLANPVIANLPPAAGSNPGEDPVNGVYWDSGIVTRVLWNKPNQYWDFVLYFSGDADNRYQQLTLANPVTPDPADYKDGTLWFDSGDANLYILYNDGNSRQWVITNPLSAYGQIVTSDDVYWSRNASNNTVYPKNATDAITNLDASLSLNADGTASFSGLTTHENGVNVTGGDVTINPGQLKQGTTTSAAEAGTGVQLNGYVRAYGNETDFPEAERSTPQPFQIISAPTASSTKAVKLSLNASGSAYFAGITEHAGGVNVTGVSGNTNKGIIIEGANTVSSSAADYGVFVNPTPPAAHTGEYIGYHYRGSQIQSTQPLSVGFEAAAQAADKASLNIGFRGVLDSGVGNNFNFYAEGTASNYFAGEVLTSTYIKNRSSVLCQKQTDGSLADDDFSDQVVNPRLSKKLGAAIRNEGQVLAFLNTSTDGWQVGRQNDGQLLGFYNSSNTLVGQFGISGGALVSPGASDYRLKTNIVDLPSATTAIKQLRPVNYELTGFEGYVHSGFIAHEVQEQIPVAVTGTKDETEEIGTLADYDGTVLESEVTEPSAEELTYTEDVETDGVTTATVRTRTWTPSGTRPVYQGVDQTKLIPLLTKALQEALTRIEALEAQVNSQNTEV